MQIEITGDEFTIEAFRAAWADDATLTRAAVELAADAEYAWLVNNTPEVMYGWHYTGTGFAGPLRPDAVSLIMNLTVEAADYVVAQLDEIKAEAATTLEPAAA